MTDLYARVALSQQGRRLDKLFDYRIPERLLGAAAVGCRVVVPFGASNKRTEGFVAETSDQTEVPLGKIKDVIECLDDAPILTSELMALARWMHSKYYCGFFECLRCIMPAGIGLKVDELVRLVSYSGKLTPPQQAVCDLIEEHGELGCLKSEILASLGPTTGTVITALKKKGAVSTEFLSTSKQYALIIKMARLNMENPLLGAALEAAEDDKSPRGRVLRLLSGSFSAQASSGVPMVDLMTLADVSDSPIRTLEKSGLVIIEKAQILRNSVDVGGYKAAPPPELTAEQQGALSSILEEMKSDAPKPVLLHGVTGSGKTEIYLKVIEETLASGKQAVMLVPEISLTPQTVGVFYGRFGDKVTVTHSRLGLGERYDQWRKARDGQASVMIGPRSAVFAPFKNLGAIIVDEEHENTYKSEKPPKYSAKEVAIERARLTGAVVVLGSATPSLETYYKALGGEHKLLVLPTRINNTFPNIQIVDMRKELEDGNRSIFSGELFAALAENISAGKQSMLFLNRRGHSTFISCRKCGEAIRCTRCDVSMTFHSATGELVCHMCGRRIEKPSICPSCGSKFIKLFGVGTQKVEEEAQKLFPKEKIIRMDMDTTTGKNAHRDLLQAFRDGEASILIGTQMIAKGLDFPNVTLVGVVAADITLYAGDFRAAETTFQLLTQVSGRSGRADSAGKVIIQTYAPEHYAVEYTRKQDYEGFYRKETALRRILSYPPYAHIFVFQFVGPDDQKVIEAVSELRKIIGDGDFTVLGPAPAKIGWVKNKFRWRLIIKAKEEEDLKNLALQAMDKLEARTALTGIYVNMSMDPSMIE
ncbi:MAG: primosomal protein N' [Clostridiales bacterium]|jgi:primosomal protein N' (replication factor Y)|nr:primosomal protein N' [Clostridiales bacterium]